MNRRITFGAILLVAVILYFFRPMREVRTKSSENYPVLTAQLQKKADSIPDQPMLSIVQPFQERVALMPTSRPNLDEVEDMPIASPDLSKVAPMPNSEGQYSLQGDQLESLKFKMQELDSMKYNSP